MPRPTFVPWDQVGDGSIFNTARVVEEDHDTWPQHANEYYGASVDYALRTLMSFVTTFARDNTLLIILGDHQPISVIAGENASHDVPIHIIAHNAALLTALDEGNWAQGMQPTADSPALPMDTLRERILGAFTPRADQSESPPPEAEPETPPPTNQPQPNQ
jgi:hypothetical protein